MTTYRLFPTTNGPASATTSSGPFIAGVLFATKSEVTWFNGYYLWCTNTGQSTSAVKCALWSVAGPTVATNSQVVPGSVVTSGTLVPGTWNFIPLSTPIQLAPGFDPHLSTSSSCYIAAIGMSGNFPDIPNYWTTGAGSAGITNGPLVAFSATSPGTLPPTSGLSQAVFSTASSDPSVNIPLTAFPDNFCVDVQISDTAPAGYSGSYRLWPNKVDSNANTTLDNAQDYDVCTEIHLSQSCTLNNIWYYSPSGAASLATQASVWNISSQLPVARISSPTWLTPTGATATAGAGWIKTAFPLNTTLPAGFYRVGVYNANGTGGGWSAKDANTGYFTTGVGTAGLTSGPLFAPNQASASPANFFPGSGTGTTGGQPVFVQGPPDQFPNQTTGTNPAQVYWIDLEVTPVNPSISGPSGNVSVAALPGVAGITVNGSVVNTVAASLPGTIGVIIDGETAMVAVGGSPGTVSLGQAVAGVSNWFGRLLSTSRE